MATFIVPVIMRIRFVYPNIKVYFENINFV